MLRGFLFIVSHNCKVYYFKIKNDRCVIRDRWLCSFFICLKQFVLFIIFLKTFLKFSKQKSANCFTLIYKTKSGFFYIEFLFENFFNFLLLEIWTFFESMSLTNDQYCGFVFKSKNIEEPKLVTLIDCKAISLMVIDVWKINIFLILFRVINRVIWTYINSI